MGGWERARVESPLQPRGEAEAWDVESGPGEDDAIAVA